MEFIGTLAMIMLTLVGYSSGCILGGRGRKIAHGLLDPLIVMILWAGTLVRRGNWNKWLAILIGLFAGMIVGLVVTLVRRNSWPAAPTGLPPKVSGSILKRMWNRWKAFAAQMGNFQSRILLILFYFSIVTPFGLLVRWTSDPLQVRHKGQPSLWTERPASDVNLGDARRQF